MFNEIGSEFWIDDFSIKKENNSPEWLKKYGNFILTASGRDAITLILEQINPKVKTVLLPSYICESVILPFVEKKYKCFFYNINSDLTPSIDNICLDEDIGIFLHMGYFGFPTNLNLDGIINKLKKESTIIIEDVTHSLFSNYQRYTNNDFYIGSIRKWFGVPSGGFVASANQKIAGFKSPIYKEEFVKLRSEGLIKKSQYTKTQDDLLKQEFLNKFLKAEKILNEDLSSCSIDKLSLNIINTFKEKELIAKRRQNFRILSNTLININYLDPIFSGLTEDVCPMFYPVLIKKNRNYVINKLVDNKIYCPIHWPKPNQVYNENQKIYDNIVSIPIDQRYNEIDMKRIISVFKDIYINI